MAPRKMAWGRSVPGEMRHEAETAHIPTALPSHLKCPLPEVLLSSFLSVCHLSPELCSCLAYTQLNNVMWDCSFQTLPCSFPLLISHLPLTQGHGQQSYAAAWSDKNTQDTHTQNPAGSSRDWDTQYSCSYLSFFTTAGTLTVGRSVSQYCSINKKTNQTIAHHNGRYFPKPLTENCLIFTWNLKPKICLSAC